MAKRFIAYASQGKLVEFSFDTRDDATGVLGTVSNVGDVIAEADDLESLEHEARAYLGREPDEVIYLADAEHRVFKILLNEKYHSATELIGQRLCMAIAMLVLTLVVFVANHSGKLGLWAVPVLAAAWLVYFVLVTLRLYNEIEAAVVCTIFLVLTLLFVAMYFQRQQLPKRGTQAATVVFTREVASPSRGSPASTTPFPVIWVTPAVCHRDDQNLGALDPVHQVVRVAPEAMKPVAVVEQRPAVRSLADLA